MAQEPERQANEPAEATKLMIDRPTDFKFHVTENMKQML